MRCTYINSSEHARKILHKPTKVYIVWRGKKAITVYTEINMDTVFIDFSTIISKNKNAHTATITATKRMSSGREKILTNKDKSRREMCLKRYYRKICFPEMTHVHSKIGN